MIQHKIELRVRYGETDQMGFCYYGNYAQYLEVARVETLRFQGINYKELEEKGILLPVRNLSVRYVSPAKYDDLLSIKTIIKKLEGSRIVFTYQIRRDEQLIATAETELVFVSSKNFKPVKMPESFQFLIDNLS